MASTPSSVPSPWPVKLIGDSSPLAPPGPVSRQRCSTESTTSAPACVRTPAEKSTADVAASLAMATSKLRMSVETLKEVRPLTCADTTTLAFVSAAETGATMASTRTLLSAMVKKSTRRMVIGDRYTKCVPRSAEASSMCAWRNSPRCSGPFHHEPDSTNPSEAQAS